jgi:5-methylcytosine-specific restriction endonuclease McrBC regulatory subunit McrC
MCAPQLCQKPIALNCDPLSLSLSFPLERVFQKFLSHYSKRMIVKFAIKKQEKWVGLSKNNLRNIQ